MEVAPNVVDATAVDLSDVMDGENDLAVSAAVPVFNPMDWMSSTRLLHRAGRSRMHRDVSG